MSGESATANHKGQVDLLGFIDWIGVECLNQSTTLSVSSAIKQTDRSRINDRNEAGILTARKDLDYIGRDELLEALKRQKGTFETGQEDTTEIPEELRLRLAYREAAVAVIACYFPEPLRPFVEPAKYVL
ncbi:unnamed protein product [Vicia faba]|uniref:Uncharacterized protein n=1 Tax=Vicia faba TaxID=3906 RepID=A0AAV0YC15_VICFA|nr:unnamed protein product [Vicia faba]CAI8614451.1 unnamed protein product [Vicia faba]